MSSVLDHTDPSRAEPASASYDEALPYVSVDYWVAAGFDRVLPAHCRTRQVVLLYDERTTLPGLAAMDASIARTLTSSSAEPVEVYRESMDLFEVRFRHLFASSARLPSQEICRQEDRCGRLP